MVSIREQVSWVNTDKGTATEKAKALISGGVGASHTTSPSADHGQDRPNVLVVGGGIAGIQAALEIADAGYHVYLVEREPSLGGHMAQFDKTFPTLDCSACILTPKMFTAGNHKNITLLTYSEVEKVDGYIGNFTVRIPQKARKVNTELHRLRAVRGEVPEEGDRRRLRGGPGLPQGDLPALPPGRPQVPRHRYENCTYFQRGTCKVCQKFCPTGAIDFNQEDDVLTVRSATSSSPPASTSSTAAASRSTATAASLTCSPAWSSSASPTRPAQPAGRWCCATA
jgi:heterodisulfide reductase subunit A2